jgi:hypothetical protein
MARRRTLASLSRADIGKQIEFVGTRGRQIEGIIRAFTHGVFSHESAGEVDVPRVLVTVQAFRSFESHWSTPEALATITDRHPSEGESS